MANSMDTILVKYSGSKEPVSIQKFMSFKPEELNKSERKIQEAIRLVYDLNGKEPPLYRKFSTFRQDKHPLMIDTTLNPPEDSVAIYNALDNKICFKNKCSTVKLAAALAHELKHAEQEDEETHRMRKNLLSNNAYGFHQFTLLQEAQAYAVEAHVGSKASKGIMGNLFASDIVWLYRVFTKLPFLDRQANEKSTEEKFIRRFLPLLSRGYLGYKKELDRTIPIGENDVGMDHIPKGWGLSQSLLKELKKIPKKSATSKKKIVKQTIQQNRIPQNALETSDNTYKQPSIQQALKTQSKSGVRRLKQNSRRYAGKRAKTPPVSKKIPEAKINQSKGDFSL